MYEGLAGIGLIFFGPPILAGILSVVALKIAARVYRVAIRRPLSEIGLVFGVALYIYTVVFLVSHPIGGNLVGHASANLVTTGILVTHLDDAFAQTTLTPDTLFLRDCPGVAMTVAGVKGVTVIAILVHFVLV